jgi:hypothetical protein
MCASCGCGKFEESHGDERNLTLTDLKDAAEAGGVSLQEVAKNIQAAAGGQQQPAGAGSQTQQ